MRNGKKLEYRGMVTVYLKGKFYDVDAYAEALYQAPYDFEVTKVDVDNIYYNGLDVTQAVYSDTLKMKVAEALEDQPDLFKDARTI